MNRVKERRESLNLTQKELSELSEIPLRTISRIETEDKLTANQAKLLASPLKTTRAYLLGDTETPEIQSGQKRPVIDLKNSYEAEFITLPVYDIRTCAGLGTSHFEETPEKIGERMLPVYRVGTISVYDDRKPFVTMVEGDSMSEAGIRDGDEVVVNPAEEVCSGDVAMVCFGDSRDVAIKWLYNLPGGEIELRSATPGFPVIRYTKEQQLSEGNELVVLGRVMSYTGAPKRG